MTVSLPPSQLVSPGDRLINGSIIKALLDNYGNNITSFSFTNAHGISGTVTNPTTTPNLTLSLGIITPTSVVASGSISGSNLSGTNTGDQTIILTGAVTGAGTGSFATTYSGIVPATTGGTGVANNAASTITISGNFGTTFTVTNTTSVTLPTSGTLVNSTSGTIAFTGGTIDGVTIGATTPVQAQGYRPINNQVGTTYAPVLSDSGKLITLNNGSAITLTIPANASVAFPVGTEIDLVQLGAGQVTVAITSDTLNSFGGLTKLAGQYAGATLKKIASTTWILVGNLA